MRHAFFPELALPHQPPCRRTVGRQRHQCLTRYTQAISQTDFVGGASEETNRGLLKEFFRPRDSPVEALGLGQMRIKEPSILHDSAQQSRCFDGTDSLIRRADRLAHSLPAKAPPRHRPRWLHGLERNSLPREAPKPHWPASATAERFAREYQGQHPPGK